MSWQQTSQYVVFVHGWNMTYADSTNFAETMFKRLWQRGYTGRFVRFYWPTYVGDFTFNDSEYRAWKCGKGLKQFMASLPNGYTKDVVSHSMGAVVSGSALQMGMKVDNYVALNAAISASCFDDSIGLYQNWNYTTPDGDADVDTRALGYRGQFESIPGNLVSFYLTQDYATTTLWENNNSLFRPQGFGSENTGYFYNPQDAAAHKLGISYTGLTIGRFVTTPHEAMAYVDQSRTKAAGAESRTAGAFKASASLDIYNFGSEHSAEFNFSVQKTKQFYNMLLDELSLPYIR